MANLFQKIGQKIKDVTLGTYHQFATNDNGQNFRSYQDEEERRRKIREQQQAAQQQAALNRARQQGAQNDQPAAPTVTRPGAKLNIGGSPDPDPLKLLTKPGAPTAAAPFAIKPPTKPTVPQVPKAPLPDQEFKGFTMDQGKNKTIFGWNAAALLPKSLEKTYGVKVDRSYKTNKDKFVAQFDQLGDDFKKVYVNQVKEQAAKGDQTAINTMKALTETGRMKGNINDFAEGANDKLYGGLTRGTLRIADLALPGKNTFSLESTADKFDPSKQGTQQYTQRGKQGEKFGSIEKGIVDLALIMYPGGAADAAVANAEKANNARKLIEYGQQLGLKSDDVVRLINSGVKAGNATGKTKQLLTYAARIAPGSVVGSAVDALQTVGRGDDVNVAKSTGIGLATDLATPIVLKPVEKLARKGIGFVGDKITGKAAAQGLNDLTDEATNDLVDHSLTFTNIRDKIRLPGEDGGIKFSTPDIEDRVRKGIDTLSADEREAADRAATALAEGDDDALRAAQEEMDRIRAQSATETPAVRDGEGASVFTQPAQQTVPPTSGMNYETTPIRSTTADAPEGAVPDGGVLGGTLNVGGYPRRLPGESDYAYLQRTAAEMPEPLHLPEDHSAYFNMGKAHDTLPINSLDSTKTAAENAVGGTNAPKFMQAARDRVVGKRDPIKVVPTGDGRFKVIDGNGTLTAVSNYGWENVPVEIVNKQHYDDANALAAAAERANAPFQSAMKDAAARLGVDYHEAPVKRVERILEKGVSDYAGDMTKVQDTVRGTMQIQDPAQLDTVLQELSQAGQVARVKNGYDGYTGGYRDIKVNIRTPDGHLSEVILASPEMLEAKHDLGGHKLYEVVRTGNDELGKAAREMEELYSRAAAAEDSRLAASSGEISLPSTAALSGGNGTPVDTTSPVASLPSDDTRTMVSSTSKNASNGSPDSNLSDSLISDTPSSSIVPENTSVVNDGIGLADNGIRLGDPNAKTPRGFVESVKNNILETPELRSGVNGSYDPINNADTLKAADDIIAADPEAAIARAKTSPEYDTETQAVSLQLLDRLQAAGRTDDAIEIVEAMAERATKAGQATQILAAYNKLTPEGILAAAQREITKAQKLDPIKYKNLKITEEQAMKLRTMAEELKKLPEGSDERRLATRALLNEISKTVPTPGARKFVTLWKAGLLTGVKGAVAGNTVGNTAAAIMRKIADVPAAMLDTAIAKATGQRSKTFTLKGLFGGFGEGVKVGVKNFKEGVGAGDEAIKLDYKKVNFGDGKLGRAAQKYTDSVFNFYSAADRPFYHAALRNNLEELAQVEAKNAGLSGRAAKDYARAIVAEPPDHIITQAVEAAEEATFQGKNALGSALSGAKRGLASKGGAGEVAGEVLMPFTGVPAAIAKQVYEYSPANAVVSTYKAIKQAANSEFDQAAQRRLTEALGRGITGTGVLWLGNELHKDGILTLGWPTDPKERALWESEGKQPYSIKIGGRWRSMNYTGSIMSLLAVGGQIDAASKEGGGIGAIPQGVAASGKAIIGSTPLQGLQGGLDAVTDPERYGEKFVNNTAGSVVPTIVKDIAVANDPLQRQVDNPIDAIQSRIPGARNGLPAKVDVFGNDMPRQTTAIGSVVDPFKSSADRSTPVTQEMRRLQDAKFGVNPPKIDKSATFDGVETKLTPEQITDLTKRTNLKVQEAWKQAIADPSYQALSDEDKSKALSNIASDFAAAERQRYAAEKGLGQYAPDAATNGNKPAKLSGKQDAILNGGFDLSNYTSGTSSKLSQGLTSTSKDTIVKIEGMPAEKRKEYLKDPKNSYQYDLAKYENDLRAGKLSDVDQYEKLQELGKSKVKSNYSKEAVELYGLSKTKLNDYIAKKGGVKQSVLDEVIAMDQQLANEGFISKPKFGGGIGSKGGGSGGGGGGGKKEKTINVPKPNFGSFRLVEAPKTPAPTMQSVMADLQRMFADIKVLQGIQIAPGSDSSDIKIAV